MNLITRKTINDVSPIPFKSQWQVDNKQWLKERKQQWKVLQANISSHMKSSRDLLKAEKHFFLTGEFPEEAGIMFNNGKPGYLRIWHLLPLLPQQNLSNWLALFEWVFEYETVCFEESVDEIKRCIADNVQLILSDKKGLYNQEDALKLYKMAYGDTFRPEPFRFEQGTFYGCPLHRVGHPLFYGNDCARAYYYHWIAYVESYFTRRDFKEKPAFPILDNFDYLLSCFPYIDEAEFELEVMEPEQNNDIIRNNVLRIMLLVNHFIDPRAPIDSDTPERRYAARLEIFFDKEVPEELKRLWEYAKTEPYTVIPFFENEYNFFVAADYEMENSMRYDFDEFSSLVFNQVTLQCEALPKNTFFNIIHQCISQLSLTDESFDESRISLVNIKGVDPDDEFIEIMGYKVNQAIPAWRYQLKATEKLLNINDAVSVIFEALVVFPKNSNHQPILNLHLRTETPFIWDNSDFQTYSELMFRQIGFNLINHPVLNCQISEEDDFEFQIFRDLLAIPKYDFPAYKGKKKPVWE